jgi:predicted nucleic acid-binding Zn ribbon protein
MNREEYLKWYNENKSICGSFGKENWHIKRNTLDQFKEIFKLTDYLPLESTFRERVYHLENNLFSVPLCKCKKPLTFVTTNSYSKKCKTCGGKKKYIGETKSKNIKTKADIGIDLKDFIFKNLLNKNNKLIPKASERQYYINNECMSRYEELQSIADDNNISILLALDFVLYNNRCKSCNVIIHSDREFCSTKCSTNDSSVKDRIKETCLEKFGVDNPFKNERVKEVIKIKRLSK